jgi:hypothetical protein
MRRGRTLVGLQLDGHSAQPPIRLLHAQFQRQHRLRLAGHRPFPVRVGQDRVRQQVRIRHPGERDPEFRRMRPIKLETVPGLPHLRKAHLLRRTMQPPPLRHPPLERAQRAAANPAARHHLRHQILEEHLRFQFRRRFQPLLRRRPDRRHRIHSRAPIMHPLHFLRPLARPDIAPCRFRIHPRLHRGMPEHPAVVIGLHESLILLIGDEHGPAKRPDPTDLADQPTPQIPSKFQGSAVVVSR